MAVRMVTDSAADIPPEILKKMGYGLLAMAAALDSLRWNAAYIQD